VIVVPTRAPLGWRGTVTACLVVGAAAMLVAGLFAASPSDGLGFDFRFQYFAGAESVLEGRSLYVTPDDPALTGVKAYVYPPLLAIALVPFTVLPVDAAVIVALVGSIAALMGAVAIAGVRDVRCHAALLLWAPAWNALEVVNLSATLALAVALVWRYRGELWPLATVLGLAVAAKLFLWPLVIWAAATRGLRSAGLAAAVGLAATAAAWAVVGFDGFSGYPALLRRLAEIHAEDSYSLVGIAAALGFEPPIGQVLMLIAGGALIAACVELGRQGDERRAFTCAIVATLALSPIVWQHYLVLLVVPLALRRPRFSAVWLLPVVLWLSPRAGDADGLEPFLPAFVVIAFLYVLLARPHSRVAAAEAAE